MGMDISKKLQEVLGALDKSKVSESKKNIENLLNSPEGQKLKNQLGNVDKDKLINAFLSMDTKELKKKLQNVDTSKLSNMNADDIINKLNT